MNPVMRVLESMIEFMISVMMWAVNLFPGVISEPFRYAFMQRALLTAIVVGVICGVLSCYVVLKRWALLGDAISHAVLPGVAVAYLLAIPFSIGAFISGALTALGIGALERNTRIKADSAMGLVFTGAFALGVVIISRIATSTHLMHILFGNVLGVRMEALIWTVIAGTLALLLAFVYYKQFLLFSFDPTHASAIGMNTGMIHYGLMMLLTLTIVASLETVGVILVVAMLIIPGTTAGMLTDRLPSMMAIAVLVGAGSSAIGLYLSFVLNVASGGTIVLVGITIFLPALVFGPNGLLFRKRPNAAREYTSPAR
ncbi:MAG: metal ABC transporter permease [Spirochaetales bacterium]